MKDNEFEGEGDIYDYGARLLDLRLGRFISVDPISKKFPFFTPYQYAANTPLQAIDIDGEEPKCVIYGGGVTTPVIGFISGALDIDRKVIAQTNWIQGSGDNMPAYTIGTSTFYGPEWAAQNKAENIPNWVGLVGHESTHRSQFEKQGTVGFLTSYLSSYIGNKSKGMDQKTAYRAIPQEMSAYFNEDKISDFFQSNNNIKRFIGILGGKDNDVVKADKLEALGMSEVLIPHLKKELVNAQKGLNDPTQGKFMKGFLTSYSEGLKKLINEKQEKLEILQNKIKNEEAKK